MYKKFNKEQQKACLTVDGRVLVLAGAGSGKTSVLTQRILHLISKYDVNPEKILGLTFTNKAAAEMRERITKHLGKTIASKIPLFTFHSFCLNILKKEIHHLGYTSAFTLYDEKDKLRLESQVLERLNLEEDGEENNIPMKAYRKELMHILKAYNAIDFDGLLELTVKLFTEYPEVLEKYGDFFRYVMIDEYQDTNPIQYELISQLTKKQGNLFVVGDDDQSIYGFRGSKVDHILSFPYDIMIKLEENYRSDQPILDIANAIIEKNSTRHNKVLFSKKTSCNKPRLFHAPTEAEEAESIIHRLLYLKQEKGLNWNDIAILYRSNNLSKPFEVALLQASWKDDQKFVRGIPYHVVQGTSFYERAEEKDLFSYLRIINNPKDTTALFRILNYPKRGISANTIEEINKEAHKQNCPAFEILEQFDHLNISNQGKIGLSIFNTLIENAKEKPSIEEKIKFFIHELNLKEEIKKEVKSEQARIFKLDNLTTCAEMAKTADKENVPLSEFINGSMLDDHRHAKNKKKDGVQLLTFHSAKGLEFQACFLVSLEDGILPHDKSIEEGCIEEERRLFYVAITRAKKYLSLSMAKKRLFRGKPMKRNACRFLFDIPKEQLEFEAFNNLLPYK